jgi:hypothetical protein
MPEKALKRLQSKSGITFSSKAADRILLILLHSYAQLLAHRQVR